MCVQLCAHPWCICICMHVPMPVHAEVGGVLLSSSIVVIFKSLPPNLEFVILARLSGQRTFTLLVLRYHVCPTVMWTSPSAFSQSPHCDISCYFIEVMENVTSFFISCYRDPNPHLLKQHLITESPNSLVIRFLDMTLMLNMRVLIIMPNSQLVGQKYF